MKVSSQCYLDQYRARHRGGGMRSLVGMLLITCYFSLYNRHNVRMSKDLHQHNALPSNMRILCLRRDTCILKDEVLHMQCTSVATKLCQLVSSCLPSVVRMLGIALLGSDTIFCSIQTLEQETTGNTPTSGAF